MLLQPVRELQDAMKMMMKKKEKNEFGNVVDNVQVDFLHYY